RLRAWPVLFVLCVAWLSPASAKPNEVAAKVDAAVTSWMAERHIADAEVAVALHKDIVGAFDHGWKATDRQPVASLSKAITGLCIAGLVDHKQLSLDEPLGTALAGYFAR
ncbi:serine hydrolase, partial [Mesorhizobium sp. M2D.F.Ca.ET.223.01.1.1]|uniref:serine hydrolase n=1 Tax=Mesorhizobium sp. M2D.F.Ca.ET.223.01.1.1 TaxID=2563940 RepID=UPI00167A1337